MSHLPGLHLNAFRNILGIISCYISVSDLSYYSLMEYLLSLTRRNSCQLVKEKRGADWSVFVGVVPSRYRWEHVLMLISYQFLSWSNSLRNISLLLSDLKIEKSLQYRTSVQKLFCKRLFQQLWILEFQSKSGWMD